MADLGTVGSASVELRAKNDRFKKDLSKARKTSSDAGKRAGRSFGKGFAGGAKRLIGPALAGLFTAAAFKGFLRGAEKAIDKLDEIAKTADAIGITTDALQELRVAADLSGVSAVQLDTALRKFSRAAAEAADGVTEYKESFDRLGITVTDNTGKLKPLEDLIGEVADGFVGMDDATRKAALAQDLFGRSGVALVNLLNESSEGIERMREEARKLGIVMDESLIRNAVKVKDELTLVRKVIDADLTQAMVRAGPLLVDLARALSEIARFATEGWEGLRLLAGFDSRNPVIRTRQISDEMAALEEAIADVNAEIAGLGDVSNVPISEVPLIFDVETGELKEDFSALLDERVEQIEVANEELASLAEKQRALIDELNTIQGRPDVPFVPVTKVEPEKVEPFATVDTTGVDAAEKSFDSLTESIRESAQAEVEASEDIRATIETLGQEASVRDNLLARLEAERLEREILAAAQAAGLDASSAEVQEALALANALAKVSAARRGDQDALEKHKDAAEEASSTEKELQNVIENTGDALLRTSILGGDYKQVLGDLLISVLNLTSTTDALELWFGALLKGGGGGGGGGTFGNILGSILSGIGGGGAGGGAFPVNVGQLTGFADGGFASKGTLAMVGEQGPELGVFGSSARIFSNDDLKQILRAPVQGQQTESTPANVIFNITTPDVGGFRRSQPHLAADFQQFLNQGNRQG